MYYVYVLQSKVNDTFYVGYSTNYTNRLKQHNSGESKATKPFRPYKLIFLESFLSKKDAKAREVYLKSGWGLRSIKKMLKYYLSE